MKNILYLTVVSCIFLCCRQEEVIPLETESIQKLPENDSNFGILHTVNNLTMWHAKEREIVELFSKRVEFIEQELDLLKQYLKDYSDSSGQVLKHLEKSKITIEEKDKFLSFSAVLSYRMAHRYASMVTKIRELFSSSDYMDTQDKITQEFSLNNNSSGASGNGIWVSSNDLFISMMTTIHTQEVYMLHPEDMINGWVNQGIAGENLNAIQFVETGLFALHWKRYSMAVDWLETGKELIKENSQSKTCPGTTENVSGDLVNRLIKVAIQQHNRVSAFMARNKAARDFDTIMNLFTRSITNKTLNQKISHRELLFLRNPERGSFQRFQNLCMGNTLQTAREQKDLKCYVERKRHPYLYINPVKTEVLSVNPPIWQFYEVVSHSSTENFKEIYHAKTSTSESVGFTRLAITERCGTNAGLCIKYDKTPKSVLTLAEFVTGLKFVEVDTSTQYAEYVTGKLYHIHNDTVRFEPEMFEGDENGSIAPDQNRIATMLFYLEIAEQGGSTPFIDAGVYPRHVKGSAILWYNMYFNGLIRHDVEHGSCPVLSGAKIILNHFFRYVDNWDTQKCKLNKNE